MKNFRTLLFVPAIRNTDFAKIGKVEADAYILDLEDSVPAGLKAEARANVLTLFKEKHPHTLALRINPLSSIEGLKDLQFIIEQELNFDLLIPSKINSAEEIKLILTLLKTANKNFRLFPLIETARGIQNVFEIAELLDADGGLLFGAADFAAEIGRDISWELCAHARSQIVLAAAMHNIPAIDTPFFDIDNISGLILESERAKKLGFTGKLIVHPNQIKVCNLIYSMDALALERYKAIIATAEDNGNKISKGAKHIIGPPFVKLAKKLLALAHIGT